MHKSYNKTLISIVSITLLVRIILGSRKNSVSLSISYVVKSPSMLEVVLLVVCHKVTNFTYKFAQNTIMNFPNVLLQEILVFKWTSTVSILTNESIRVCKWNEEELSKALKLLKWFSSYHYLNSIQDVVEYDVFSSSVDSQSSLGTPDIYSRLD